MEQLTPRQTDKELPVRQSRQEPTSEHSPLPIGCAPLDDEQQRMWDDFYKKGKERDKRWEEARKKRKEQQEAQQKATEQQKMPKEARERQTLTPLQLFQKNLDAQRVPATAKKLNIAPKQIEQYLAIAYSQECDKRNVKAIMDEPTNNMISIVSRWLSAESHTKGSLLLRGYLGVGKTTMLRAIKSLFIGLGLPGIPIKSAYEINELAKDKSQFDMLKAVDFLAIDDLGQEPSTIKDWGNERNPFEELISARYDRMKQTLISTNLVVVDGKDQIAERYGERIADRLREMCNIINYDPNQKSYRK